MTDLTDDQLAAIEARAAKATLGKWRLSEHSGGESWEQDVQVGAGWFLRLSPGYAFSTFTEPAEVEAEFAANAAFIAHAREDIPALTAALRRAWEERETLRYALGYVQAWLDADADPAAKERVEREVRAALRST
jgi:hypothetical protein